MIENLQFSDFAFGVEQSQFKNDESRPLEAVRLLVVDARTGTIKHDRFENVLNYFEAGDHLIWNRAGISKSRLNGVVSSGATIDVCFLLQHPANQWEAIVLSETHCPESGRFELGNGRITGELLGKISEFDGAYWIEQDRYVGYRGFVRLDQSDEELRAVLMSDGKYMHPWYTDLNALAPSELNPQVTDIERGVLLSEPSRRFTSEMLDELRRKEVRSVFVSLAMSFSWNQSKPDMRLSDYKMNAEEFELPAESAEILRTALAEGRRIISIGTSCVRVLESVSVPPSAAKSRTDLFISPGFEFKYCDALLTNLHNTMGTHVIMAGAFGGRELVIEACRQAVKENYRFGIFGDSMLVFGNHVKAG